MSSENHSEILMYQTEDGQTKIDVKMEDETVWLTQPQIVELLQSSKSNISEHIKHIFDEGELEENAVVRNFRTTAADGKKYDMKYYNLDVIISVGYRVKSHRGTQFRIWATQRLKEYIIKGFTMNDDLLKKAGGGNYFDELLHRIRDIRILTHAGKIKHEDAVSKAEIEYEKYKERTKNELSSVERDFLQTIDFVEKKLSAKTKKNGGDRV